MKKIILITGYDRCGKDYVTNKLKNIFDADVFRFADELKLFITKLFNIDLETLDKKKNNGDELVIDNGINKEKMSYRKLLNVVGTALRETFGDNFFARSIVNKIETSEKEFIILSDTRFLIEVETIKDYAKKNKYDIIIVKIESDLDICGSNGFKYEVPKIETDLVFINTTKDKEKFNRGFNCFVDKMSSRLNVSNPLKEPNKVNEAIFRFINKRFMHRE